MDKQNHYRIDRKEWRLSLFITWLIISLPLLAAVALPLVASGAVIDAITPKCISRTQYGRECPACGLTTAFVLIGHGQWSAASASNQGSIPLYGAFVMNSFYWVRALARLRKR